MPLSRLQTCICHICKYVFVTFANMYLSSLEICLHKRKISKAGWSAKLSSLEPKCSLSDCLLSHNRRLCTTYSTNVPSLLWLYFQLKALQFETKNTIGANASSLIVSILFHNGQICTRVQMYPLLLIFLQEALEF